MSDLRQGVSKVTRSILDLADTITATDPAMPEDGKMRTFDRAQRAIDCAADPTARGYYRRASLSLAAAILIAMANEQAAVTEARTKDVFAKLGYRQ